MLRKDKAGHLPVVEGSPRCQIDLSRGFAGFA
jgi:hypothetical protein